MIKSGTEYCTEFILHYLLNIFILNYIIKVEDFILQIEYDQEEKEQ